MVPLSKLKLCHLKQKDSSNLRGRGISKVVLPLKTMAEAKDNKLVHWDK